MGHGACGGVHASLTGRFADARPGEGGFIAGWMSMIAEARDRVAATLGEGPAAIRALELECVRVSLANLMSFPFIVPRVADGRLKLHGAWFAIAEGELHLLDPADGAFHPA